MKCSFVLIICVFFFSQRFLPQQVSGAWLIGPSFAALRGRKTRIKANVGPRFAASSSPCWWPELWLSSKLMSPVPVKRWIFALPTEGKFGVSVPGGVLSLLGVSPPTFLKVDAVMERGCSIGSEVWMPFYRCCLGLWLERRACCCAHPYLVAAEHPLFPGNAWSGCWSQPRVVWGGKFSVVRVFTVRQ